MTAAVEYPYNCSLSIGDPEEHCGVCEGKCPSRASIANGHAILPVESILPKRYKNSHLSVSRVRLYEVCALAFYFNYVDKGPKESSEAPQFGNVLHDALEETYRQVMHEEYTGRLPIAWLTKHYQDAWMKSVLVGVGLYQEGLQILRKYAESHFDVDHFKILAVEQEFNIPLNKGEFTLNGYIDRVDKIDDTSIRIIDYKSNRKLYDDGELANDLQFASYGLAARVLYPWATRIEFEFHMLRHDVHQVTVRTAKEVDEAEAYLVSIGRRSELDTTWAAKLNENCSFCDHRARCETYRKAVAGELKPPRLVLKDAELLTLVEAREKALSVGKAGYGKKNDIDKVLAAKLEKEGEFRVGDYTVKFQNGGGMFGQDDRVFGSDVAQAFLQAGFPRDQVRQLFEVSPKVVDAMLAKAAETLPHGRALMLKIQVEACATKKPSSKVDVKKVKR